MACCAGLVPLGPGWLACGWPVIAGGWGVTALIRYRPQLIDGCLAGTGLKVEPW